MSSEIMEEPKQTELQSPLLQLPPELRNRIYNEVLIGESSVQIHQPCNDHTVKFGNRFPPALLQTCRTIRGEANQLYFGLNTFILVCEPLSSLRACAWTSCLTKWLLLVGEEARSLLQKVYIEPGWDRLHCKQDSSDNLLISGYCIHDLQRRPAGYDRQEMMRALWFRCRDLKGRGLEIRESVLHCLIKRDDLGDDASPTWMSLPELMELNHQGA